MLISHNILPRFPRKRQKNATKRVGTFPPPLLRYIGAAIFERKGIVARLRSHIRRNWRERFKKPQIHIKRVTHPPQRSNHSQSSNAKMPDQNCNSTRFDGICSKLSSVAPDEGTHLAQERSHLAKFRARFTDQKSDFLIILAGLLYLLKPVKSKGIMMYIP